MSIEIDELKESNDFLNTLLDNITSAVFIADMNMRMHSVNNALQTLFTKPEDEIIGELCGNALGCQFSVLEKKPCGTTSQCYQCILRNSLFKSFTEKVPTYRGKLKREFYIDNHPILKYLQFSTKYIHYHNEEMVLIIVDDITETETQRISLDEDLKAAAEIQRSLLPAASALGRNFDVAWQFLPCQHIGGDIFNMVQLDEHHWAIYMLDVSGHGVPSAMMVVSISQLLQPYAGTIYRKSAQPPFGDQIIAPSEVLNALDQEYPFERFNNFFTIIYLVLDTLDGSITYSNAGHPKPVMVHADGSLQELQEGGAIIGSGEEIPFGEGMQQLQPGDKLFMYTDGIIEYDDGAGAFYGKERFFQVLQQLNDQPIDDIAAGVITALKRFGNNAEPQDDISLLCLEFRKP
jgi:sigma-B regulation protein RsbU (phosphoserine phosphatase)